MSEVSAAVTRSWSYALARCITAAFVAAIPAPRLRLRRYSRLRRVNRTGARIASKPLAEVVYYFETEEQRAAFAAGRSS